MLEKTDQEALIRNNYVMIYNYCLFRIREEEAASDLAQETFALMIEKAEGLQNEHLKQWLLRTAAFKCSAFLRKRQRERRMLQIDAVTSDALQKVMEKVDDRSFGAYYETYLEIMMRHLSAKEALLCELRFVKGLSSSEIGRLLGIKENAVNARVSRLKKKMEKIIEEDIPYL